MKALFVGTGLIGGSFSLALKEKGMIESSGGFSRRESTLDKALELGIIDEKFTQLSEGIAWADWIFLSIPVDAIRKMLPEILNQLKSHQCVIDFGSTKGSICADVKNHPNRKQFIAAHPISGTEYSGPEAAFPKLFENKSMLICDRSLSDETLVDQFASMSKLLDMHVDYMDSEDHDRHLAYISHLSHVTSFALSNTVLEKEKDGSIILEMAGSGFTSTVRLAKSLPEMWAPIFLDNKEKLLEAIAAYSRQVSELQKLIEADDLNGILQFLENGRNIRRIIK